MSAKDISRFLFQPEKHYSSVRMQQGRVILDSDWNESERIDDEQARRTLLDIICSRGTSNGGFGISDVILDTLPVPAESGDVEFPFTDVPTYDFRIAGGSFYLGGLRFEMQEDGERFLDQNDWLQIDADALNLPPAPTPAELEEGERFDLVYLRGWEQCVTAVEDSELRERALGGPDTSVRIRRMRRVEVLADTAPDCASAFGQLADLLSAPQPPDDSGNHHELDGASGELRSKARLTVAPSGEGITEDPCKPKVEAGFLGAENQAIRVELTATNRFIWGIDNAAPYYRVQVLEQEGEPVVVKFLSLPRDQQSQPLKGQAVEIHPWGALLSNQEKVAELQGHLATVDTSFDPETRTLTITEPIPQVWLDWLDHPDHAQYQSERDPDGQRKYFYLRLWTGGSGDAAEPDFAFTPGTPVGLPGTGLEVSFSELGLPGDHWIIAARPHTPGLFVAWELMTSAPPAGTRSFFAPLAVIRWSVAADPDGQQVVQPSVHDCRSRFRPLCEVRGCCTVTVGDGVASHGDFQAIQDAIDSLPPEGGEVCVLPGVHEAAVTVHRRRNIRIHGCWRQTLIVPAAEDRGAPLLRIVDSQGITLERMDMITLEGTAVIVSAEQAGSKDIEIGCNRILAWSEAIRVDTASEVNIHHNRIRMLDKAGGGVGIALSAEDALIERNDIGVVPAGHTPPDDDPGDRPDPTDPCEDPGRVFGNLPFLFFYTNFVFQPLLAVLAALPTQFKALGGIHLAAGTERVKVLQNTIGGGAGNGITLGGTLTAPAQPADEPGEPGHVIVAAGGVIAGKVADADGAVAGAGLAFTRDAMTISVMTSSEGEFAVEAEPGKYVLTVTSPGLGIDEVMPFDFGSLRYFAILVSRVTPQPDPAVAFLSGIEIDDNEIRHMGLSGIGLPLAAPVILSGTDTIVRSTVLHAIVQQTGHPVIGLGIRRNLISRCLGRIFDDTLRAVVKTQGLGGVSLGTCAYVDIRENRIEDNGRDHLRPACGIFVRMGAQVEIQENLVSNNGPIGTILAGALEPGERGGVVVSAISAQVNLDGPGSTTNPARPAARVHDNIVLQPAGQALRVISRGATSVCNNRLATEIPVPVQPEIPATPTIHQPAVAQPLAGAVNVINVATGEKLESGATLFNDNQVRLASMTGVWASVLVTSGDDVGFDANQLEVFDPAPTERPVFVNTVLAGHTLRAIGNRFRESPPSSLFSLLASLVSAAERLNNTSHDQGDHCIFVSSQDPAHPPVQLGNQIVDSASCDFFVGVINNVMLNFSLLFRR